MSVEPCGPTTEELRARVLAAERALELLHERGLDALNDPGALKSVAESVARIEAFAERLEGRTFYDPAREHVVTFEARAHRSLAAGDVKAALIARCACGWSSVFVPNEGREAAIFNDGLRHVSAHLTEKGEAVVVSPVP